MASIGKYGKVVFSARDVKFIKNNFHIMSNTEIALALGLTLTVVRNKCHELGLKHIEMEYWTPAQVQFLKNNYKRIGDVEMAEIFQRRFPKIKKWTCKHIEKKRRYLNLQRTRKMIVSIKTRNRKAGRFSVNHWRRWEGRQAPNGEIRTWRNQFGRPVKVIKIDGKWIHLAPWLYRKSYGNIPKGCKVRRIDPDKEVTIENLYLVTTGENAAKNSLLRTRSKIPLVDEKLSAAKKMLSILQNKINQLR